MSYVHLISSLLAVAVQMLLIYQIPQAVASRQNSIVLLIELMFVGICCLIANVVTYRWLKAKPTTFVNVDVQSATQEQLIVLLQDRCHRDTAEAVSKALTGGVS